MFDFDMHREPVWDDVLRPLNEGEWNKEPFAPWWARHRKRLAHLHPQIAEQWIHKHWLDSRFAWLPLKTLTWSELELSGEDVLALVHRLEAGMLDPAHDYDDLARPGRGDPHPSAKAFDRGSWDYPLLILRTPSGIRTEEQDMPDVRTVLVEGHQRHRYLNALHARGTSRAGPHKLLVLESPFVR